MKYMPPLARLMLLRLAGVLFAFALHANAGAAASAPVPTSAPALLCAETPAVLQDFFGQPLPGSPAMSCGGGAAPASVLMQGQSLPLYAFGSGPAPITTFGGIERECNKLLPGHASCFSTNPFTTALTESTTCGYPAAPAYVLACKASGCVAEIYSQACGASSPDLAPDALYSAPGTPLNVGGALYDGADFSQQDFSSQLDFTPNLNIADRIVRQGRVPVLGLAPLLMDDSGALRPTAEQDLRDAMARFPLVFGVAGLNIVVYDEPFIGTPLLSLPRRVNGIRKSIDLLNRLLPAARLGVVVAPVWSSNPLMVASLETILSGLQFVATDTYAGTLDTLAVEQTVARARNFANYMKLLHPSMTRWLVIQGFAPVYSALPDQWTPEQHALYARLINGLAEVAHSDYAGAVVWGWSNGYELPDAYTGKFFPPALKQLYRDRTLGQ